MVNVYANTTIRDASGQIVGYSSNNNGIPGAVTPGQAGYIAPSAYSQFQPQVLDPNSAAGIAQMLAASGGQGDPFLQQKAIAQGYTGVFSVARREDGSFDTGRNVEALRNSHTPYGEMVTDPISGRTIYNQTRNFEPTLAEMQDRGISNLPANYPYKEGGQIQLGNENGRFLYTKMNPESGEVTTWGTIAGHSGIQMIGGGGSGSAQSGKISLGKSQAGVVFNQDLTVNEGKSQSNWRSVLDKSGSGFYSDVGAEAYGGKGGVPTSVGYTVGSSPGKAQASEYGDATWWASALSAGEKNARTNTIETPMSFQNDGRGTLINAVTRSRYEKSEETFNLANYVTPSGLNYEKGNETPGMFGIDALKNYGTTPMKQGDIIKTEPQFTLQRVVTGGTYDEATGRIFGNVTEKNPQGYWDASLQVLPNQKFGQSVSVKERDASGDLKPRDGLNTQSKFLAFDDGKTVKGGSYYNPFNIEGAVQKTTPYKSETTTKVDDPFGGASMPGGAGLGFGAQAANEGVNGGITVIGDMGLARPFTSVGKSAPTQPNNQLLDLMEQATGGRIQSASKPIVDFAIQSVPNVLSARPITNADQITNETQRNGILSPLTNQIEISRKFLNDFVSGGGNKPTPEGYGVFGVMAANEGTLITPDYSSPMSVESGMNYGSIRKPFMSGGGGGEPVTSQLTTNSQTQSPSENWVQGVPVIGGVLSSADATARERFGVGIFAKTSEINSPVYSEFVRGVAPIETTTTSEKIVDRSSIKNAGADWTAQFIGADNKPTQQLTVPVGEPIAGPAVKVGLPYMKDGVEYQDYQTPSVQNYQTFDLSKVTLQQKETTIGASPFQQKYDNTLSEFQSRIPSKEEGERVMQFASLSNPVLAPAVFASAFTEVFNPSQKEQAQGFESLVGLRGQYSTFYDNPILSVGGITTGVVAGVGVRAIGKASYLARIPIADAAISQGGKYRTALQTYDAVSNAVVKTAPYAFSALYAADIGGRSIEDGVSYASIGKAKGIFMQEAVPMGVGGMLGYRAPEIGARAYKETIKAWNAPDTNRGLFDNSDAILGRGAKTRSRPTDVVKESFKSRNTGSVSRKETVTQSGFDFSAMASGRDGGGYGGGYGGGGGGSGAISRTRSIPTIKPAMVNVETKILGNTISRSRGTYKFEGRAKDATTSLSATKSRAKAKSLYDVKDYDSSVSETTAEIGVASKAISKQKSKPTYDVRNYDSSTFETEISPGVDAAVLPVEKPSAVFTPSPRSTAFSESTPSSRLKTISTARAGWMSISRAAAVTRGSSANRVLPDSVIKPDTGRVNASRTKEETNIRPYVFVSPGSGYIATPSTGGSSITSPLARPSSGGSSFIDTRIVTTKDVVPVPKPPIPIIPPVGFFFTPGSSSGAGGRRGRGGAHREIIGIRSSLEEFFGERPPTLTKRRRGGRNF